MQYIILKVFMHAFPSDTLFEPTRSDLRNCRMNVTLTSVVVDCDYHRDSSATGFQVIIQQGNIAEIDKIYVGQATDRQSRVSVEIGKDEQYALKVSVIATQEETGILDSTMEVIKITGMLTF